MSSRTLLCCSFLACLCLIGCSGSHSTQPPAPQPPTANAGGPYSGTVGTAVTFSGGASHDPQNETLTYAWNFGDSSTGAGPSPTHTYKTPGTYAISLTVTDTSNLTGTATSNATIAAAPPTANAGGPYLGRAGTAVTFDGSKSSDPQNEALSYSWNFGDNTTGTGVSPTHIYTMAGSYTVTLTVTNTSNISAMASAAVSIPNGNVQGALQPVSGAHVYLFAANTTGYGKASVSLLSAASTGLSDSVGAYVITDSMGNFIWSGDYSCTPGAQVYLYALGGDIGMGNNSAAGLLAVVGACPAAGNFDAVPYIQVNEASTVAAAYAMVGFAVDATHVSSSGTALAENGISNAFANAANLVSLSTGQALATTPAGNGAVPQAEIDTLADVLSGCVASAGPSSGPCATLLSTALVGGASGAAPTDTATAAINIAHNPGANVAALYALSPSTPPFSPALSAVPNDFTIGVTFTGGGLSTPIAIAIDGSGNAWIANRSGNSIVELSSSGSILSGAGGYTGGGLSAPSAVAIDPSGNAWTFNVPTNSVIEFSSSGSILSGANGYSGGGLNAPIALAIDGSGDVWVATASTLGNVFEFSNAGSVLSGASGYSPGYQILAAFTIAIDGSGDAWVPSAGALTEFSNTGTVLSGANGYKGGGLGDGEAVAFDHAGDAWIINISDCSPSPCTTAGHTLVEFSSSGSSLLGSAGLYSVSMSDPSAIAIDGGGNVWITNYGTSALNYSDSRLLEFSNSASILSPNAGYTVGGALDGAGGVAVDGSGDVWLANHFGNSITEVIGAAVPVVTPLSVGIQTNDLGARP